MSSSRMIKKLTASRCPSISLWLTSLLLLSDFIQETQAQIATGMVTKGNDSLSLGIVSGLFLFTMPLLACCLIYCCKWFSYYGHPDSEHDETEQHASCHSIQTTPCQPTSYATFAAYKKECKGDSSDESDSDCEAGDFIERPPAPVSFLR